MTTNQLQKLKGKLTEMQKNYEECAEFLGISITAFSNKINGKTNFNIVECKKLSDLLEMTSEEFHTIFLA